MEPDRWARVKRAAGRALDRPPEERGAVLDEVCAGDPALRRDVEHLLGARGAMGRFLEDPIFPDPDPGAAPQTLPAELLDWPRYDVIGPLGSGGMATVYKAWDPRLRRLVAVKVIGAGKDSAVRRFLQEAEAQARIDHDHVVKVYETGRVGTDHYIAMQFVHGPTLLGVRDETDLPGKAALIRKVAGGLDHAHQLGVVHRDIKPGNILVERGSEGLKPYLLDFGLAAEVGAPGLTTTGVVVGTPKYMPPERIEGADDRDPRSDIYSLGATFYELIAGIAPFGDASGLEALVRIVDGQMAPLSSRMPRVPAGLETIVSTCLARNPRDRYPSARALADDLDRYLAGETVRARPARWWSRLAARFTALFSLLTFI